MAVKAKIRIETQIRRRKKTASPVELESEWEAEQGAPAAGLKMTSEAMAPRRPDAAKSSKSVPA
jgi:hypothetical protein